VVGQRRGGLPRAEGGPGQRSHRLGPRGL